MDDNEILNKLIDSCNNYDIWLEKIKKLKNIVDNEYNLDKYIEKILNIISN